MQALFSMVFFDTKASDNGGESIIIGWQWWLFPTITILLMIMVFAIWVVWQQYQNRVDLESLGMRIAEPELMLEKSPDQNYQSPV